ncbi:MAG TPA: hypothetical protein VNT50_09315 [Microbacterium sp.]|uniref:hypothetical protein n=1 Tax=Microbacterium sp. TaxID=51671 RepID=UPI002C75CCDD|nr:hypothetical protein [Microbacterium sp.]HWI31682.1 hypothetical protein [Microbacterium sp.]
MTSSDIERTDRTPAGEDRPDPRGARPETGREIPARPALTGKEAAPVIVKRPAPFSVRLSQLFWVLSLAVGAAAVVYLFVIRQAQLPEIQKVVRAVDPSRVEDTYKTAADIIYWSSFGVLVALMLVQVTLLVSFSNRRPNARWWLFGTFLVLAGVVLVVREMVAVGDRGVPLERLLLAQLGLALLALLVSVLPPALRWTARQHDVARRETAPPGAGGL